MVAQNKVSRFLSMFFAPLRLKLPNLENKHTQTDSVAVVAVVDASPSRPPLRSGGASRASVYLAPETIRIISEI